MGKIAVSLLFVFTVATGRAQIVFKTIVPQQPVAVGEAFPVQYVLEDVEKNDGFTAPFFKDLRLVSGPYEYKASVRAFDGQRPVKNIVFTLVAIKTGKFIIPGATAKVGGRYIKSDDAILEVISKNESSDDSKKDPDNGSEYFLRPGEDPYEKIKKNLFMRVHVDRHSCYVGQPVVATYKLYSRLESKSDIVKNPGFYGFAVQDMVGLNDKLSTTETLNGKAFDVHTIRKVQLYPLQAGQFLVDAMEVLNKVEFSKSAVNRKTEQQIVEGVFEPGEDNDEANTVTYENSISTDAIAITVKPYPIKNKPAGFNGATGRFSIHAELEKNEIAKNEEGDLLITIEGKGNFTQVVAPNIAWPQGIDGFDPAIKDAFDKTISPLKGSRTFRFPFVATNPGAYKIPAVSISVFDPDSNSYKTISTSPIDIKVTDIESAGPPAEKQEIKKQRQSNLLWWLIAGAVIIAMGSILALTRKKRRTTVIDSPPSVTTVNEFLLPAALALKNNEPGFYKALQKSIWDFFSNRLQLTGSRMNKHDLELRLVANNVPIHHAAEFIAILQRCEEGAFTEVADLDDKQELFQRTKLALESLKF